MKTDIEKLQEAADLLSEIDTSNLLGDEDSADDIVQLCISRICGLIASNSDED